MAVCCNEVKNSGIILILASSILSDDSPSIGNILTPLFLDNAKLNSDFSTRELFSDNRVRKNRSLGSLPRRTGREAMFIMCRHNYFVYINKLCCWSLISAVDGALVVDCDPGRVPGGCGHPH